MRILSTVSRQIRRLDVSQNLLGPEGVAVLTNGLSTLRSSSSTHELWGLKEINLGSNALDDDGMIKVLNYAKKDVFLSKVLLQGNEITVSGWKKRLTT